MKTFTPIIRLCGRVALSLWVLQLFAVPAQSQTYELQLLNPLPAGRSTVAALNRNDQAAIEVVTPDGKSSVFHRNATGEIEDVGKLGTGEMFVVTMNDTGQILGLVYMPRGPLHGFFWSQVTGLRDLGTLGGDHTRPWSLNNRGQVVGESVNARGQVRPFIWTLEHGMKELPRLASDISLPTHINDAGQIIGFAYNKDGRLRAFYAAGESRPIEICSSGLLSRASHINGAGKVAGYYLQNGSQHVFSWTTNAGIKELDQAGENLAIPSAICNQGQIVGEVETDAQATHACLWTAEGKLVLLAKTHAGLNSSMAVGINSSSTVIGRAKLVTGEKRAFVWNATAGLQWLPMPPNDCESVATAINDKGTIAGYVGSSEHQQACLWRPVPPGKGVDLQPFVRR